MCVGFGWNNSIDRQEHFDKDYELNYYWNPLTGESMWDASAA
jgi:hypothetical protein